jgi:hypothetical protein
MYYDDNIMISIWMGITKTPATGRVMVDVASFNRYYPNYGEFEKLGQDSWGGSSEHKSGMFKLEDEQLWMTWPTLPIYCLKTKKWGEAYIDKLQEIVFRQGWASLFLFFFLNYCYRCI